MVISPAPSIWPFVVKALGFELVSLVTRDTVFRSVVGSIFPQAIDTRTPSVVHAIFSDWSSLPLLPTSHWQQHTVPHVFTMDETDKACAPAGWHVTTVPFDHATMGGLTSGTFILGVMLPMTRWRGADGVPPPPLPTQAPIRPIVPV